MLTLVAEDKIKQMFFPTFEIVAIGKKYFGKAKVHISIQRARLSDVTDKNLNFLISASKFLPYLEAYKIPPNCPNPSFKTHVNAAAPNPA